MKALLTVFTIHIVIAFSVAGQNPVNKGKLLIKKINDQFIDLDSLQRSHFADGDIEDSLSRQITSTIKKFSKYVFSFQHPDEFSELEIVKSADDQFCLISWDTRMGGTEIDYAAMAVYKTPTGIKSEMLFRILGKDDTDNVKMKFEKITTIKDSNYHKIYLAHGYGKGGTGLAERQLRAFTIINGRLAEPSIFPKKENCLSVGFDVSRLKENQEIPEIRILQEAKLIRVPMPTDYGGFNGKWLNLAFNGQRFVKQ